MFTRYSCFPEDWDQLFSDHQILILITIKVTYVLSIALLDYLKPLMSCASHKAHSKYLSKMIPKLSTKKCTSVFNFVPPNYNLNENVLMDFIYIYLCQT